MDRCMTKIFALLAAALVALSAGAAHATPMTDAAKARCQVGERIDGYLGIVPGADVDAALRREVREVNQKRAQAYADLGARNGVSQTAAAQATAERLINAAPSGHCVQMPGGDWAKVP